MFEEGNISGKGASLEMSLSPTEKKHPQWEGLIAKNTGEKGSALPELSGAGCGRDNWAGPVVLDAWAEETDFRREQETCKRETKKKKPWILQRIRECPTEKRNGACGQPLQQSTYKPFGGSTHVPQTGE